MSRNYINSDDNHVISGLIGISKEKSEQNAPIPLGSLSVIASVVHSAVEVEITQMYVNNEKPIEAFYCFPIDFNATLTSFHAELEGRTVTGVVKSEDETQAYKSKVNNSKEVALLGGQNSNIFKVSMGLLNPETEVKIVIRYVTEVEYDNKSNRMLFFLPKTVAPHFTNGNELSAAPLSIEVNVMFQANIKSVESLTHTMKITKKGHIWQKTNWNKIVGEFTGSTTDLDRDFVLAIKPAELHKPMLCTEKCDCCESSAVLVNFISTLAQDDQKVELIFVLDRSGSMGGLRIDLAKQSLEYFLRSAPSNCYFNIVGFGSDFEFLFPDSVEYDDTILEAAFESIKEMNADMGGTEVMKPLTAIFEKPLIPEHLRHIFLLTDGDVSNKEQVISLTEAHAHNNRVYTIGIEDANRDLVEGVACAGGGTSAFVVKNENIEIKVLEQLKHSLQPLLTEIEVTWNGLTTEKSVGIIQAPQEVPSILSGSQMVSFGVFKEEVPTSVTITANSPDGRLKMDIPINVENNVDTRMIHKLAASKIIRELELEIAALPSSWFSSLKCGEQEIRKEIIEISCENGIASKYASFVIDDDGNNNANEICVIDSGYVSSDRRLQHIKSNLHCKHVRASGHNFSSMKSDASAVNNTQIDEKVRDNLHTIVCLQSFSGTYTLNNDFCNAISVNLDEMKNEASNRKWNENAWATILALTYYSLILSDLKDTWELMYKKSIKWLSKNHPNDVDDMFSAAAKLWKCDEQFWKTPEISNPFEILKHSAELLTDSLINNSSKISRNINKNSKNVTYLGIICCTLLVCITVARRR